LDSEALWECLKGEAWAGRKVCIVRGEGGRDWLATQWAQAGAELSFLEAYRRCDPEWRADQWAVARSAAASPESAVWLLSSSESLGPLHRLLPGRDWSTARAWASHPRIGAAAEAFGFGQVHLLQPGLPAVVEAVLGAVGANSTIAPSW
jgi:uroporphyrinogen-III synthase